MYLVCKDNLKFEESGKLIKAAHELGIETSDAPWTEHVNILDTQPYFIYGTRSFVLDWVKDVYNITSFTEYLYDYSFLLSITNKNLPLFNSSAKLAPAGQIKSQIDDSEYLSYYKRDGLFVRPNDGNKSFTGTIIQYSELTKIQYLFNINPWHICIYDFCRPIPKEEYRFFVKRNSEAALEMVGCRYSPEESNSIPSFILQKAKDYSEFIFDRMTVGDYFVLDLFVDEDDNVKVGEINSWNSSGYYCIDPKSILRMIFNV